MLGARRVLPSLAGRRAVATRGIDVGLADRLPSCGLGEVHLAGHCCDTLAARAHELDHLGLELLAEAPTRSPLLRTTGHRDILSGASPHTLGVRQTGSTPIRDIIPNKATSIELHWLPRG